MALPTLTFVDLFYFIMSENPCMNKNQFGWGPNHIRLHLRVGDHTTWFWRWSWDNGLWTLSFGLIISWSRLLAHVGSGPNILPGVWVFIRFLFSLLFYIWILHIPWQFPCGAPISTDTRNTGHDFHSLDLLFLIHLLADRTKCFFTNPKMGRNSFGKPGQ
jgi:hypothetical protein